MLFYENYSPPTKQRMFNLNIIATVDIAVSDTSIFL